MHEIDLAAFDLNLLVTLDVLLTERSVTRAATRLGRTQSSTSHALARIRDHLGDPILLRAGGGLRPTPLALRLADQLPRVLRSIRHLLESSPEQELHETRRTLSLAGPDFLASVLPVLGGRLAEQAPHASLELVGPRPSLLRELGDGTLDLVVIPRARRSLAEDELVITRLARLPWTVFARRDHPAARRFSLRSWQKWPHVVVRTGSAVSPVDRALSKLGVERRVAMFVPTFLAAAPLLVRSDYLLTAPRPALAPVAEALGLIELRCPLELPPIVLWAFRSAHRRNDPVGRWLLDQLRDVLEG